MSKMHFQSREAMKIREGPICGRVPKWIANSTTDPSEVDCSYCLKFLAKLAVAREKLQKRTPSE